MSVCVLCQKPFTAGDTIIEQRLISDTEFCNICFTEFMTEQGDTNIFSTQASFTNRIDFPNIITHYFLKYKDGYFILKHPYIEVQWS
jgi:hypothetical protein